MRIGKVPDSGRTAPFEPFRSLYSPNRFLSPAFTISLFMVIACATLCAAQPTPALTTREMAVLTSLKAAWPFMHANWSLPVQNGCLWSGITCEALGPVLHIVGLNISFDSTPPHASPGSPLLTFPGDIGELIYIRVIKLHNLGLSGTVPYMRDLRLLKTLDLRDNYTGDLRLFFSHMPSDSLSYLSVVSSLSGVVPIISPLEQLETLILVPWAGARRTMENSPSGKFDVSYLPRIKHIDIHYTMLSCDISKFRNSTEWISATSVFLQGDLSYVCNFPNLTHLSARGSYITGSIPECLGSHPKLNFLDVSHTRITGPLPSSFGKSLLSYLDLSETNYGGSLPEELGNAQFLESLLISDANLLGTIPPSFSKLSLLTILDLSQNDLSGTVPALPSVIDLKIFSNELSGDLSFLPESLALASILASNNRFEGPIPLRVFEAAILDLSDNANLLGPLPNGTHTLLSPYHASRIGPHAPPTLSEGQEVPTLHLPNMGRLNLRGAHLGGFLPHLVAPFLTIIDLVDCQLGGFILPFPISLEEMDLTSNPFNTTLPPVFPPRLRLVSLSKCHLQGPIPSDLFVRSPLLDMVNLERNKLEGPFPAFLPNDRAISIFASNNKNLTGSLDNLVDASVSTLTLANAGLVGTIPWQFLSNPWLQVIDLSSNSLEGTIEHFPPNIETLSLRHNELTGGLPMRSFEHPSLMQLDVSFNKFSASDLELFAPVLQSLEISNNQFRFNLSKGLGAYPELEELSASHNPIYGSALPNSVLKRLKSLSLRNTSITGELNFHKLKSMLDFGLSFLDISSNPQLTPSDLEFPLLAVTGVLSKTSPPPPPNVECYLMVAETSTSFTLQFDTPLFNYDQCQCKSGSYGRPPECLACSDGLDCKDSTILHIKPGTFAYVDPTFFEHPIEHRIQILRRRKSEYDQKHENTIFSRSEHGISTETLPNEPKLPLYVETCGGSEGECRGIDISPDFLLWNFSFVSATLAEQCHSGSTGRLCAHCLCSRDEPLCYFPNGFGCSQCPKHWKIPSRTMFWTLTALLLLIIFFFLTIIMTLVLKSKRTPITNPWDRLSFVKRASYRILHFLDLAALPILVTFLQILSVLTDWEGHIMGWLARIAKLTNADAVGLGIWCFNPDFSHPQISLVIQQLLPLVVAGVVIASTASASLVYRFWAKSFLTSRASSSRSHLASFDPERSKAHTQYDERVSDVSEQSPLDSEVSENDSHILGSGWDIADDNEDQKLLGRDEVWKETPIHYPMTALLVSTVISVFQFFYFSSALAASNAFFYSRQPYTNDAYLKSLPWMQYAEASMLRTISGIFIFLIVIGFPLAALSIIIYFRARIYDPKISVYFGSMVTRYRPGFVWWEFARLTEKLLIAILMRSLGQRNPTLPGALSLIIGAFATLKILTRPWKRSLENATDSISSILLMISLLASGLMGSDRYGILWPSIVIDAVFIAAVLALGVFFAWTEETSYQLKFKAKGDLIALSTSPKLHLSQITEYLPILRDLKDNTSDPTASDSNTDYAEMDP